MKNLIFLLENKNINLFQKTINTLLSKKLRDRIQLEEEKFSKKFFIKEDVYSSLEKIVNDGGRSRIKFSDGSTMTVDLQTANVLLTVYKALDSTNKEKFLRMINKDTVSFMKVVDFSWKRVK